MPAIRRRSLRGQGRCAVRDGQALSCQSICPLGRVKMQMRGKALVLQRQNDLDDAGNAGGAFKMPDIGLHGTNQQRIGIASFSAQRAGQGACLDRVAQGRTGPVRLHIVDLFRPHAAIRQSGADDILLRRSIRHGQTRRCARPD